MPPRIAQRLRQTAAAAEPGAVALAVPDGAQRDDQQARGQAVDEVEPTDIPEELPEEQRKGVLEPGGVPPVVTIAEDRVVRPQTVEPPHEHVGDEERERPLHRDEGGEALLLVRIVVAHAPAVVRLQAEPGHDQAVRKAVPEGPVELEGPVTLADGEVLPPHAERLRLARAAEELRMDVERPERGARLGSIDEVADREGGQQDQPAAQVPAALQLDARVAQELQRQVGADAPEHVLGTDVSRLRRREAADRDAVGPD